MLWWSVVAGVAIIGLLVGLYFSGEFFGGPLTTARRAFSPGTVADRITRASISSARSVTTPATRSKRCAANGATIRPAVSG